MGIRQPPSGIRDPNLRGFLQELRNAVSGLGAKVDRLVTINTYRNSGGGGSGGGGGGGGGDGGGDPTDPTDPPITPPVVPVQPSLVLTSSPLAPMAGDTVTLTAAISGNNPTGAIYFYQDGNLMTLDPVAIAGGAASVAVVIADKGDYTFVATYPGDANNLSATSNALSIRVGSNWDGAPPPPTNLTLTSDAFSIYLRWNQPYIGDYAFTEVWGVVGTNSVESAAHLADVASTQWVFSDHNGAALDSADEWYFWVRIRDTENLTSTWCAANAPGWISTTPTPGKYLDALAGAITETELFSTLGDKIALIGGPTSVDARIATEAQARVGYATLDSAPTLVWDNNGAIKSLDDVLAWNIANPGNPATWHSGLPVAQAVKQVAVSDGVSSVALEQRFVAQKSTNDSLYAQYTVKIDNDGYISGFGLASAPASGSGKPYSDFMVRADRVSFVSPTVPTSQWSISGNLTHNGVTASVTLSSYTSGLAVNDTVVISNVDEEEWNRALKVTGVSAVVESTVVISFAVGTGDLQLNSSATTPAAAVAGKTAKLLKVKIPFVVLTSTDANGTPPGVYMSESFIKYAVIEELMLKDGAATNLKIGNIVKSTGFPDSGYPTAPFSGWRLRKDGSIVCYGSFELYDSVTGNPIIQAGKIAFNQFKRLILTAQPAETFTVAKTTGTVTPATITLIATAQNITPPDGIAWTITEGSYTGGLGANGASKVLTPADMTTGVLGVKVSATVDGVLYEDTLTIAKLQEGADALVMLLSNENDSIPTNADGTPTGATYVDSAVYVERGATDVTVSEGWTIGSNTLSGCTIAYPTATSVRLTPTADRATANITATKGGTTLTKLMTVTKQRQGVTGNPGTAGDWVSYVFIEAATAPATPTGTATIPSGWADAPPSGAVNPVWMSKATVVGATGLAGTWSTPVQITGGVGAPAAGGSVTTYEYSRGTSSAATAAWQSTPYTLGAGEFGWMREKRTWQQVGNPNLARKLSAWTLFAGPTLIAGSTEALDGEVLEFTDPGAGGVRQAETTAALPAGDYTLSFDAWTLSGTNTLVCDLQPDDGADLAPATLREARPVITTTRTRYQLTFRSGHMTSTSVRLFVHDAHPGTGTVRVANVKLESGTKQTGWCRHASDTDGGAGTAYRVTGERGESALSLNSTAQVIKGTSAPTPTQFTLSAVGVVPTARLRWAYSNDQTATPTFNELGSVAGVASFPVGSNVANAPTTGPSTGFCFLDGDSIQRWKVWDVDNPATYNIITISRVTNGSPGERGAKRVSLAMASLPTWDAAAAYNAVNTTFGTPVVGDWVDAYYVASGQSASRFYAGGGNPGTWNTAATQFSGAVLIDGSLTVDKLAANQIWSHQITLASGTGNYLQSQNFVANTSGFRIDGAGNAEFQNAKVRGDILLGGGNMVANSDLTLGSSGLFTICWEGVNKTLSRQLASGYYSARLTGVTVQNYGILYWQRLGDNVTGSVNLAMNLANKFPVTPGRRYQVSVYVAALNVTGHLYVRFYDAAGTHLATLYVGAAVSGKYGTGDLDTYTRLAATFRVNAAELGLTEGAAATVSHAMPLLYGDSIPVGGYIQGTRMQFLEVPDGYTAVIPWSPGGVSLIDTLTMRQNSVTQVQAFTPGTTHYLAYSGTAGVYTETQIGNWSTLVQTPDAAARVCTFGGSFSTADTTPAQARVWLRFRNSSTLAVLANTRHIDIDTYSSAQNNAGRIEFTNAISATIAGGIPVEVAMFAETVYLTGAQWDSQPWISDPYIHVVTCKR